MSDILDTSQFVTGKWGRNVEIGYNTRDALVYAVGIGCGNESRTGNDSNHGDLRFIYEQRENFSMFPTFPLVLMGTKHDIAAGFFRNKDTPLFKNLFGERPPKQQKAAAAEDSGPRLAFKGVKTGVDAERYIERVKSLPLNSKGHKFFMRSRLLGVHKKGPGALTETEQEIIDEQGNVYYKIVPAGMQIGAHSFTDSGVTNSENFEPPKRAPDATCELETTPEQAHFYRLSGDWNPLHIDPMDPGVPVSSKPARTTAPILHGLCNLGVAARAVLLTCAGNDPERFHALKVRFSSPVIPGDTLLTKMWKLPEADANKMIKPIVAGAERFVFTTEVKSTGKVVISNAYMDIFRSPSKL